MTRFVMGTVTLNNWQQTAASHVPGRVFFSVELLRKDRRFANAGFLVEIVQLSRYSWDRYNPAAVIFCLKTRLCLTLLRISLSMITISYRLKVLCSASVKQT